jgi:mono/diheme cytochrome c family protein
MTNNSKHLFLVLVVLAAVPALARVAPSSAQVVKKPAASKPESQQHDGEGNRIFTQNCSRCHNAPEGFSPHISGTVVRHMRVRASLSQRDEQELLRFLNP